MISGNFLVHAFEPIRLTLDKIGPFQDKPWVLDFTDAEGEPCNFFLLASENGRGKTTVLEILACLMSLLEGPDRVNLFDLGHEDLYRGRGRAQLDIRLRLYHEGQDKTIVLSLVVGREDGLFFTEWIDEPPSQVGASAWHRLGYQLRGSRWEPVGHGDPLLRDLTAYIYEMRGERLTEFEDDPLTFPTLLFFSAYRDIKPILEKDRAIAQPEGWGYQLVHRFDEEGGVWRESLDNLLVWFKWLGDGRFEKSIEIINKRIFDGTTKYLKGVRRDPPEAIVVNNEIEHRLDRLSSGEKNLIQLFLRIGAHMTRNTVLLIDEMEVHLHSRWQHRVLNLLKQLVKDHPGTTVIATTHSREILRAFAHDIPEPGLRKGGHIIEEGMDGNE